MANFNYRFRVHCYPKSLRRPVVLEKCEVVEAISTGSQETRARRRLLNSLHDINRRVAQVMLIDVQEA